MKNTSGQVTHPVNPRDTARSHMHCDIKSSISKSISSRSIKEIPSNCRVCLPLLHHEGSDCPVAFNCDSHVLSAKTGVLSGCIYHKKQLFSLHEFL